MRLRDEQVEWIRRYVEESGITLPTLADDLVDHLSCVVESEIAGGKDFDDAFRAAVADLAPNGLAEIQQDTIFLFNRTNTIAMKKVMYLVGLISSIAIAIGWLFSLLHWPGAYEMFNGGFLGFLLLFVPMLAIDRFKVGQGKATAGKLRIVLGCVSAVLVGMSLVFKLLHLQGADVLLIVGMLLFSFGFLPFLFFTMYRKSVS